ncbi:hypothetical protein OG264_06435 [Streptomyces xanthophaeus]|uniref:hypothetical protein n=1 Tax=Streptomyces xanthophaeus TaxID=67385 RepID=UPI0038632A0D|nr:hypothetical protein OG264_06435 [Streptomyces xanthophaeus]WST63851.1 hypothetical protein OG605_31925 [Streptomyces xanthophaeus]
MTVRTPALLRRSLAALTALAAVSTVSACGDQTKDDRTALPSASAGTGAPLHDRLPEDIRSAGVIRVGSDIAYPPVEFKDAAGRRPRGSTDTRTAPHASDRAGLSSRKPPDWCCHSFA